MNKDNDISVAVIIPMYNAENSIIQVLESINGQTYREYIALIVAVNDGSTDKTVDKVEKYSVSSNIKIEIINKENAGVSSARNAGMDFIEKSNYNVNWFAFCDSDDLWYDNKLEIQLQLIKKNKCIDCLGTQFNESKIRVKGKVVTKLIKGTVKDICIQNFPQPSTVIMKRKIYQQMGGFDESQEFAEDGNYFLQVAYNYELFYYPQCTINYGFGKRAFGEKGLSANLKGMYLGNIKNIKFLRDKEMIDFIFYYKMRFFYFIKYLRRLYLSAKRYRK